MALNLKADEQAAVAEMQKVYENSSPAVQKAIAQGVSWAERNFWPWTIIVAGAGWAFHYVTNLL